VGGGLRSQISELDSHIDEAAAKVHVLDDAVVEARLDGVAGHQIDSGREGHRIVHRIVRVVVVVQQRLRVDQKRHLSLLGLFVDAETVRVGVAPKVEEVRAVDGRPERGALHGRVRLDLKRIVDQDGDVVVLELVRAPHVKVDRLGLDADLTRRLDAEFCIEMKRPSNLSRSFSENGPRLT